MTEEERLAALWKIAQEIVENDPTYETGMGDIECFYCSGDNYSSKDFKHDDTCIVLKARALVADRKDACTTHNTKMRRFIFHVDHYGLYAEWNSRHVDGIHFGNHIVLDTSENNYFNEGIFRSLDDLIEYCQGTDYLRNWSVEWIDSPQSH